MPKKIDLKTKKTQFSVNEFIKNISDENLRKDCKKLLKIFKETSGLKPKMWGDSIIGFGEYTYHRSNGDEGQMMATGFSPRKSGPTLYIMPGYFDYSKYLEQLGPHKLGKSCLYIKKLEDIDTKIISKIIALGLKDLKKNHQTNY